MISSEEALRLDDLFKKYKSGEASPGEKDEIIQLCERIIDEFVRETEQLTSLVMDLAQ